MLRILPPAANLVSVPSRNRGLSPLLIANVQLGATPGATHARSTVIINSDPESRYQPNFSIPSEDGNLYQPQTKVAAARSRDSLD